MESQESQATEVSKASEGEAARAIAISLPTPRRTDRGTRLQDVPKRNRQADGTGLFVLQVWRMYRAGNVTAPEAEGVLDL